MAFNSNYPDKNSNDFQDLFCFFFVFVFLFFCVIAFIVLQVNEYLIQKLYFRNKDYELSLLSIEDK